MSNLKKKRRQALEFKRIENPISDSLEFKELLDRVKKEIDKAFEKHISNHIDSLSFQIGIENHNFLRKSVVLRMDVSDSSN